MISVLDTGLTENWNGIWIVLSLSVAVLSCYLSFSLAGRKGRTRRGDKRIHLVAAGTVLGTGTWLVHVMSLCSYHRRVSLHYDPVIAGSAFVAVSLSAYIMLRLFVKQQPVTSRLAGAAFGFGVTLMSALGILSLRPGIIVGVDPIVGFFSIAIIFISAYFALYVLGNFRRSSGFSLSLPVAALILGSGLFATQHAVLGALRIDSIRSPAAALGYTGLPSSYFVTGASILVAAILAITWTFMVFERRMLKQLAFLDPLTGLRNRYALAEYADRRLAEDRLGSMVLVNLDRFKVINDTLGRDLGDQLLSHAAQRIRTRIQDQEALFRMDGDEFLLVGSEKDPELLLHRVNMMLNEIGRPYLIEGNELYVTASAGISLFPGHGQDRSSLLKAADAALYQAKASGKDKTVFFNAGIGGQLTRKMELEKDMRVALEHGQFFIVYQPKWDARSSREAGFEALLRWRHPEKGVVSPGEFIPIAEETGLIVPMTRWMLGEVCRQNKRWQDEGKFRVCISVNMSYRVFESMTLFQMVDEALRSSGLPGTMLELEITESIAMKNMAITLSQLQQVRDLKVRVSMDDFGTGHSSLGRLDEIPVDTLKIDQSFVKNSNLLSKQALIVGIIGIARLLDLEVVAEGVETAEQADFLLSRGCVLMQGYYYGRPMLPDEVEAGAWRVNAAPIGTRQAD
ncbi:bifunctional diguanylate cyclase/phosphodiesterase [Saccharibacillus sp. O23]|uniref:putative bifunctional diguanylate cyclase/phosphodiesterase n=1 Tax=Saccharibacillus sp. O23 TaxID=2009338 RepID=UPI000B4E2FCC|nr:EAL domain-containing protein [Saccharibacillus sp. O23]OWR31703.1 bifunctional diguanylate cyclase/phosphodiesterase [Saccharibacillus sp. O23]